MFLFFLICFSLVHLGSAKASDSEQDEGFPGERQPTRANPTSNSSLGVSTIQWNSNLKIQQKITMISDYANYSGVAFSIQKDKNYVHWGWSIGAFAGIGRAVGGGNSTVITYKQSQIDFTVYGASPRIFYRFSERASAGISTLVFMSSVDWPQTSNDITIDAGRSINVATLADLNLRLFQKWDFYTGIGPLTEGATFWQIGAKYRF